MGHSGVTHFILCRSIFSEGSGASSPSTDCSIIVVRESTVARIVPKFVRKMFMVVVRGAIAGVNGAKRHHVTVATH